MARNARDSVGVKAGGALRRRGKPPGDFVRGARATASVGNTATLVNLGALSVPRHAGGGTNPARMREVQAAGSAFQTGGAHNTCTTAS
jgi:hypothetical protein